MSGEWLPSEATARVARLVGEFMLPLCRGGMVRLQRPFGVRLGLALGRITHRLDGAMLEELASARLRAVRAWLPSDDAPLLADADVALACALHDLLVATHPDLSGPLTRGRHDRLLESVMAVVARTPIPTTLREIVERHSLFHRALELSRVDCHVSWWTGSDRFVGAEPPPRVLAWPSLRHVEVRRERVPLAALAGDTPLAPERYLEALRAWVERSPLTDVTSSERTTPPFRWTAGTLALVAAPGGISLARRGLAGRSGDEDAVARARTALESAAHDLPASLDARARSAVGALLRELDAQPAAGWR